MNSDFRALIVVLLVTLALVGAASGTAVAGSVGTDQCDDSGEFSDAGSGSSVGIQCGGGGSGGSGWCDYYVC